MGDFETTVYKGQTRTEVWASALVELYTEDVKIFHSIGETFNYLFSIDEHCKVYYHNLKFDGSFILNYLLAELKYKQAYQEIETPLGKTYKWLEDMNMANNTFKYSISDKGQWYTITVKHNDKFYLFQDSLKLLPFSVKRLGEGFQTKHRKLDMEYEGIRYAGCTITDEEKAYIANDVLVVKEALEAMYDRGHTDLTIGTCCLKEFKSRIGRQDYATFFPNLYEINLDPLSYGYPTAGDYIKKSYRGGWCYLVPSKANKIIGNGTTADVNSLYPSVMSLESGSIYPVGKPIFAKGKLPTFLKKNENKQYFYFVRIRCRFRLRKNFLPFIQLKGNPLYDQRENLITSDYYDKKQKKYFKFIRNDRGELIPTRVEMVLTMMDYELIKKHYVLYELEELDYCYFNALPGIYESYIHHYREIKQNASNPVERQLAKLFLNHLYGKMAMTTDSSFKICYLKEDGSNGYMSISEHDKSPGYIACGSAITSYARCFTITAAQQNYYGPSEPGFIYADTDSIHCNLSPEQIKGITVDDNKFCCWKLESCWDEAIFVRPKTYIEHITHENLKPISKPFYSVKCAGMPDNCKDLFVRSLSPEPLSNDELEKYNEEEKEFLKTTRTLHDFKVGLKVPGQLKARNIPGGVLLVEQEYTMHPK